MIEGCFEQVTGCIYEMVRILDRYAHHRIGDYGGAGNRQFLNRVDPSTNELHLACVTDASYGGKWSWRLRLDSGNRRKRCRYSRVTKKLAAVTNERAPACRAFTHYGRPIGRRDCWRGVGHAVFFTTATTIGESQSFSPGTFPGGVGKHRPVDGTGEGGVETCSKPTRR